MINPYLSVLTAVALLILSGFVYSAPPGTPGHLRLIDRLDRPQDGYCLDILGTGRNLRLEVPVFAHNCKPTLTPDSAVVFTEAGQIRFAQVDRCLTAAGVNSRALPGAAIMLRGCDENALFFEAPALQRFVLEEDGRLVLQGSGLCLSVGHRSAPTYSPADRWRTLFVDECAAAEPARARWEFIVPQD